MVKLAKKVAAAREGIDRKKLYALGDAVQMIKSRASAKFDETVEIAMNLGVDPRHADQMVRGVVNLPNGTGRTVRVAVFARDAKADEARSAGADVVGAEDLVEQVQAGNLNFDRVIATPDMMPLVGRLGKILGPRNLMPNPKVGTVTMDVTGAVKGAAAIGGKVGGAIGGLMSVPFLVSGPWTHPSLKPDVSGVLEGGIKNKLEERLGIGGKSGNDNGGTGGGALGGIKKLFGR